MTRLNTRPSWMLLAVVSLVLAGCGSNSSKSSDSPAAAPQPQSHAQPPAADASFAHVHGLGINPRDGALFIATHTGLFRAARGQALSQRVGDSQQDVMGFTVVGPDRFLGSGHPDPRDAGQPPNLGLIRSDAAGRRWAPVSLAGDADFHVLRSLGRRVFGFNGLSGKLMASVDGGRSWKEHDVPGPMIDLAIDPSRPERLVTSTAAGLARTTDGGRSWQALRKDALGLLAWPDAKKLYWIDAQGTVRASGDGGQSWRRRGSIGGQPVALAAHGSALYAAVANGAVRRSGDGGVTWVVRAKP